MSYIRRWNNFVFAEALSKARPKEDRETLVDELFKRFEAGLMHNGRGNPDDMVQVHLVIQKVLESSPKVCTEAPRMTLHDTLYDT